MSALDDLRDDDGDPNADEVVEEFWPYDGPHSSWRIRQAAYAASRLIRYANNATQGTYGPGNAPAVGGLLSSVNALAYSFDQLLDQLARATEALADDPWKAGALYDDRRDRPAHVTAEELAAAIRAARAALHPVQQHLDEAAGIASHLGHESRGGDQ